MQKYIKKILDIIISISLIIILLPLFIIIAVILHFTTSGTIFYPWNVIGKDGIPFTGYKFRTMLIDAEEIKEVLHDSNEMIGPVFKIKNDPRITKVGKYLRKYSLDELPQLWSVLKGDMSLVGPRPAGTHEWIHYEEWQKRKLSVIPGMTCLWQVSGRNNISNFNEWVKLDLEYVDNWTLWLDIKILFKTIPAVLKGTGQ